MANNHNTEDSLRCPYCQGEAHLRSADLIWPGRGLPMLYICDNYPSCDSYVRCHPDSVRPMGTLAGPRLRKLRGLAHKMFDPIWMGGGLLGRSAAYQAAAEVMGVTGEFHIGHLNEVECERFLGAFEQINRVFEAKLSHNHQLSSRPDEMCLNVLLGVFHPTDDEFHGMVPMSNLDRYARARDQALTHGLIMTEDDSYRLTRLGRTMLYESGGAS